MVGNMKLFVGSVFYLWLLPLSIIFLLVSAFFVPIYGTRMNYFISIFSFIFFFINVFWSFVNSFVICRRLYQSGYDARSVAWGYAKAVMLNMFGGYHFFGLMRDYAESKGVNLEFLYRLRLLDFYYIFFCVIAVVVAGMMSKVVVS